MGFEIDKGLSFSPEGRGLSAHGVTIPINVELSFNMERGAVKAHKGTSSYSLPQAVFLCKQQLQQGRCPDSCFLCELWPCGFSQPFKEKFYGAPIPVPLLSSCLLWLHFLFFFPPQFLS